MTDYYSDVEEILVDSDAVRTLEQLHEWFVNEVEAGDELLSIHRDAVARLLNFHTDGVHA